jgi:hypothetical protein
LEQDNRYLALGQVAVLVEAGIELRKFAPQLFLGGGIRSSRGDGEPGRSARTSALGSACRLSHHAGERSLPAFEARTAKASPCLR